MTGTGLDLPAEDETVVCEVEGCGQEFPDQWAWQEHYEDTHLGEDES